MKILYRIYEGTEFPVNVIQELCVLKSNGDYVDLTGNLYSGSTHSPVRKFRGRVWQIVDGSLIGENSNYQNAKIPFIGCTMTFEELELHEGNKVYYCAEIDAKFHETEFDKLAELFEDAQQI